MSAKVSFEGIGEVSATFYAQEGVKAGEVVKLTGDSTVGACTAGERFCGVAQGVRQGCAGVRLWGFAEVPCKDETVTAGYVKLTADGQGGVKKAGTTDAGEEHLVVRVDADTVSVKL